VPVDPRRYLRIPIQVEVVSSDRTATQNYGINISSNGMCLQSAESCEPGQQLNLRFCLSPDGGWIEVQAEVVWCTCEQDLAPGMTYYEVGVRFGKVPEEHQQLLRDFVDWTARYREAEEDIPSRSPIGWSG
jgi:hypothetical protein